MSMKLKKVSYVYSEGDAFEKKALDEISLEIPDGQFIGIIGHTGSGKSTLIQHLNGLLRATSGAIYYDGENIYQEGYDMRTCEVRSVWSSSIRSTSFLKSMFFLMSALDRKIWDYPKKKWKSGQKKH